MRMIDADAMKADLLTVDPQYETMIAWCITVLDAQPTIEPERKTGRWLPDNRPGGGFWVCSCCKFPSEAFAANVLYKFCPHCGAYMGGSEGVWCDDISRYRRRVYGAVQNSRHGAGVH